MAGAYKALELVMDQDHLVMVSDLDPRAKVLDRMVMAQGLGHQVLALHQDFQGLRQDL